LRQALRSIAADPSVAYEGRGMTSPIRGLTIFVSTFTEFI